MFLIILLLLVDNLPQYINDIIFEKRKIIGQIMEYWQLQKD